MRRASSGAIRSDPRRLPTSYMFCHTVRCRHVLRTVSTHAPIVVVVHGDTGERWTLVKDTCGRERRTMK